jgi:hypothetical protein
MSDALIDELKEKLGKLVAEYESRIKGTQLTAIGVQLSWRKGESPSIHHAEYGTVFKYGDGKPFTVK